LSSVKVQDDQIVYGKVGTTAAEFQKAITGKKVIDAGQQGKYFWLTMSSPPHPCLHFGMSGWMKFSNDDTAYYKPTKAEEDEWPPKYWKFVLETAEEPKCEVAFVDARRLGRIRLLDCEGDAIRNTTPLKENGPDPVMDKDVLTKEWLTKKMRSKKVPVKALLLDQANISGVGNWVGDEVLYNAKIHTEQYSNTLSDAQLDQLHTSLLHVCSVAVETLADSSKFPDDWLMKHRWGKGKKDQNTLPNGEKIVFLKVGGRTSAVVPSVQKKTGPVAGDVDGEALNGGQSDAEGDEDEKPQGAKRGKSAPAKATGKSTKVNEAKLSEKKPQANISKKVRGRNPKEEVEDEAITVEVAKGKRKAPGEQKGGNSRTENKSKKAKKAVEVDGTEAPTGRRRSARVSGGGR